MQSPKFPLKKKDLEQIVNPPRLKIVWKNKVRDAARTQLVADPIENLDFHIQLDSMCSAIDVEVNTGSYIPRPAIRLLSEKSKGLCRQIVIPAVKDALILQTLSDALWVELSKKAPSKNAFYAPADHSFSNVVKEQTNEYGSINAWLKFQEEIIGFTKKRKFIIITDIANFFDCISYDHLRNILADLSIVREHALDLLIYTLSHMLWQPDYMPRVHVGLPQMNLDAPRLLAHCFLFEIDNLLDKNNAIDFARYMDDIDIGTDTLADAKAALRDLDLSLQTRQVRLNSGKTRILTEAQAARHYKIRENLFLDAFEVAFRAKAKAGVALARERRFLTYAVAWGLRGDCFATGNGEKILKRCLNYCRRIRAPIGSENFVAMLRDWPGARQNVLQWWAHVAVPDAYLKSILQVLASGEIIDDLTKIQIVSALVSARLDSGVETEALLKSISDGFDRKKPWEFYAKMWLISKYGSADQIMELLETSATTWVTQEILSRTAAAMFPRIVARVHQKKFENIIARVGSRWAQDVLSFHQRLSTTTEGFTAVRKFVVAKNPSQPNQLTHAKFLMLLSLLHNKSIAPNAVTYLRNQHAYALTDKFYSKFIPPP
jgi:hypothetical protein